ncbi:hypothetical protein B0H63DRAFT_41119 [Podospora didyma]|uniref:Uncharacterized protein n=1 Tax=Podospora didyma TaxID=330526 RepID=A0AAE0U8A6_9PEZI|nr:hypothetical protein B0H63DRAFT_41119 [Podospora didyma]
MGNILENSKKGGGDSRLDDTSPYLYNPPLPSTLNPLSYVAPLEDVDKEQAKRLAEVNQDCPAEGMLEEIDPGKRLVRYVGSGDETLQKIWEKLKEYYAKAMSGKLAALTALRAAHAKMHSDAVRIHGLESEEKKLRGELGREEDLKQVIDDLEKKNAELEKDREVLTGESERLRRTIAEVEEKYRVERQKLEMEGVEQCIEKEREGTTAKVEKKQTKKEKEPLLSSEVYVELVEQVSGLENEIERLQAENTSLKRDGKPKGPPPSFDASEQLKEAQNQRKQLEAERGKWTVERVNLRNELEILKRNSKQTKDELDQARKLLEDAARAAEGQRDQQEAEVVNVLKSRVEILEDALLENADAAKKQLESQSQEYLEQQEEEAQKRKALEYQLNARYEYERQKEKECEELAAGLREQITRGENDFKRKLEDMELEAAEALQKVQKQLSRSLVELKERDKQVATLQKQLDEARKSLGADNSILTKAALELDQREAELIKLKARVQKEWREILQIANTDNLERLLKLFNEVREGVADGEGNSESGMVSNGKQRIGAEKLQRLEELVGQVTKDLAKAHSHINRGLGVWTVNGESERHLDVGLNDMEGLSIHQVWGISDQVLAYRRILGLLETSDSKPPRELFEEVDWNLKDIREQITEEVAKNDKGTQKFVERIRRLEQELEGWDKKAEAEMYNVVQDLQEELARLISDAEGKPYVIGQGHLLSDLEESMKALSNKVKMQSDQLKAYQNSKADRQAPLTAEKIESIKDMAHKSRAKLAKFGADEGFIVKLDKALSTTTEGGEDEVLAMLSSVNQLRDEEIMRLEATMKELRAEKQSEASELEKEYQELEKKVEELEQRKKKIEDEQQQQHGNEAKDAEKARIEAEIAQLAADAAKVKAQETRLLEDVQQVEMQLATGRAQLAALQLLLQAEAEETQHRAQIQAMQQLVDAGFTDQFVASHAEQLCFCMLFKYFFSDTYLAFIYGGCCAQVWANYDDYDVDAGYYDYFRDEAPVPDKRQEDPSQRAICRGHHGHGQLPAFGRFWTSVCQLLTAFTWVTMLVFIQPYHLYKTTAFLFSVLTGIIPYLLRLGLYGLRRLVYKLRIYCLNRHARRDPSGPGVQVPLAPSIREPTPPQFWLYAHPRPAPAAIVSSAISLLVVYTVVSFLAVRAERHLWIAATDWRFIYLRDIYNARKEYPPLYSPFRIDHRLLFEKALAGLGNALREYSVPLSDRRGKGLGDWWNKLDLASPRIQYQAALPIFGSWWENLRTAAAPWGGVAR